MKKEWISFPASTKLGFLQHNSCPATQQFFLPSVWILWQCIYGTCESESVPSYAVTIQIRFDTLFLHWTLISMSPSAKITSTASLEKMSLQKKYIPRWHLTFLIRTFGILKVWLSDWLFSLAKIASQIYG